MICRRGLSGVHRWGIIGNPRLRFRRVERLDDGLERGILTVLAAEIPESATEDHQRFDEFLSTTFRPGQIPQRRPLRPRLGQLPRPLLQFQPIRPTPFQQVDLIKPTLPGVVSSTTGTRHLPPQPFIFDQASRRRPDHQFPGSNHHRITGTNRGGRFHRHHRLPPLDKARNADADQAEIIALAAKHPKPVAGDHALDKTHIDRNIPALDEQDRPGHVITATDRCSQQQQVTRRDCRAQPQQQQDTRQTDPDHRMASADPRPRLFNGQQQPADHKPV